MPIELKNVLGNKSIKKLVLRKGDFIEDRFGQMQRKIMTDILPEYKNEFNNVSCLENNIISQSDTESNYLLMNAFRWFGCYMLWQTDKRHIMQVANIEHHVCNESNLNSNYLLAGVTTKCNGELADNVNMSCVFVQHLNGRRKPYSTETIQSDSNSYSDENYQNDRIDFSNIDDDDES